MREKDYVVIIGSANIDVAGYSTVWRRCPVVMPVKIRSRRPGKEFQPSCLTAHLTVIRQSVKQSMMW